MSIFQRGEKVMRAPSIGQCSVHQRKCNLTTAKGSEIPHGDRFLAWKLHPEVEMWNCIVLSLQLSDVGGPRGSAPSSHFFFNFIPSFSKALFCAAQMSLVYVVFGLESSWATIPRKDTAREANCTGSHYQTGHFRAVDFLCSREC